MRMRTGTTACVLAAIALAGCGQELKKENEALKSQVEQMNSVSAEKDSLLTLVVENTKLMTDVNNELSHVKNLRSGVMPVTSNESGRTDSVDVRDYLLARVKEVTARVNEAETRLAASQQRVRRLTGQTTEFERSIAGLQSIIDTQKVTLASMTERINELEETNLKLVQRTDSLTVQTVALQDTVGSLVTQKNTVYYTVGTKRALLDRHVVVEEGSRFLFFGGKSLHPARQLDGSAFSQADLRQMTTIPLPDSTKDYKIVSQQNLAALATAPDSKGRIRGSIQIADPNQFWEPSRYLIVVQQ